MADLQEAEGCQRQESQNWQKLLDELMQRQDKDPILRDHGDYKPIDAQFEISKFKLIKRKPNVQKKNSERSNFMSIFSRR